MPELARRYMVMPLATEAPFDPADPDGAFVLKPWKDPAALRALRAYRDSCFPELRRDLDAWIRTIEAGPTVRGDIGRRNQPFAEPAPAALPTSQPRRRAAVKAAEAKTPGATRGSASAGSKTAAATRGSASGGSKAPAGTRRATASGTKSSAGARGSAPPSTKASKRGSKSAGAKAAHGPGSRKPGRKRRR